MRQQPPGSEDFILTTAAQADHEGNQDLRSVFQEAVQQTVHQCPFTHQIETARINYDGMLQSCKPPFKVDVVLDCLMKIGQLLLKTTLAGRYTTQMEMPPRTPTECLLALLDMLDEAAKYTEGSQQAAIRCIIEEAESNRLRCCMGMASVKALLDDAQSRLASVELFKLHFAMNKLLSDLGRHGSKGPPLPRLLDNVYGRAWETFVNSNLMENIPPLALEAVRVVREELGNQIKELPSGQRSQIEQAWFEHVKHKLPRPWADRDPRLEFFGRDIIPSSQRIEEFFSTPATTGFELAGDFFIGLALFEVLIRLMPDQIEWRLASTARYVRDVIPLKGRPKFQQVSLQNQAGAGITLAHQIPACDGCPSVRAALVKIWDLDDDADSPIPSANMLAIKQGLPYSSGISGHVHIFVHFFLEIQKRRRLDMAHAVLGLLVYMVHDGGHPWNEGLQAVNYLESILPLNLLPQVSDPITFVADYSQFIALFDNSSTKTYLSDAVKYANKMTLLYRRAHCKTSSSEVSHWGKQAKPAGPTS